MFPVAVVVPSPSSIVHYSKSRSSNRVENNYRKIFHSGAEFPSDVGYAPSFEQAEARLKFRFGPVGDFGRPMI
jgi:hypothetical protein